MVELGLGATTLNAKEVDVPKYQFNLAQPMIGNFADWQAAEGTNRPLFTFVGGKYTTYNASPADMLKENPEAEILVGYLDFE